MAKARGDKGQLLENRNNEMELACLDSKEHANIDRMPPLLEWNQKKVGDYA